MINIIKNEKSCTNCVKWGDIMEFTCNDCNLNYMMEECREKLNNIIVEKKHNLLDEEVISLSQLLDDLVYRCACCDRCAKVANY